MDYPTTNIPEERIQAHDVLCGKGKGINTHEGNARWRQLVKNNREQYVTMPRHQKIFLSQSIVLAVRSLSPPGRFLVRDNRTNLFNDIGDSKAIEKTSQALREGAPELRKKLKEAEGYNDSFVSSSSGESSRTETAVLSKPIATMRINPFSASVSEISLDQPCEHPHPCSPPNKGCQDTFAESMEGFTFTLPKQYSDRSLGSIQIEDEEMEELEKSCSAPENAGAWRMEFAANYAPSFRSINMDEMSLSDDVMDMLVLNSEHSNYISDESDDGEQW